MLFLRLFFLLCVFSSPLHAVQIIARVGDDIISDIDLSDRVANLAILNGIAVGPENKKKLEELAFRDLVDELVFTYEAKAVGLSVSPEELNYSMAIFCEHAGLNKNTVEQDINRNGGSFESLKGQLSARLLWDKILNKKFGYLADVSDREVNSFIKKDSNSSVYVVDVILFSIPREHINKTKEITKIVSNTDYSLLNASYPYVQMSRHEMFLSDLEPQVSREFLHAESGRVMGYQGSSGEWLIIKLEKRFSAKKFLFEHRGKVKVFSVKSPNDKCVSELRQLGNNDNICESIDTKISTLACRDDIKTFDLDPEIGSLGHEQMLALSAAGPGKITDTLTKDGFTTSLMFCAEKMTMGKAASVTVKERLYREKMQFYAKPFLEQLRDKYIIVNEQDKL